MSWDAIVWLVLLVVFLIAEAATVAMVSLWFAAGALVSMIAALLHGPLWLQAVLFFAVSGICLALLRPVTKKYLTPKVTRTNADSVLGTCGYVTEDVDNVQAAGRVKLDGKSWSARSTSGAPIPEGTLVKADRIEGVKVFVSPAENAGK